MEKARSGLEIHKNPYFNRGSIPGFHVLQGIAVTSDVGPLAIP
jgi:hypothetical protein